MLPKKGMAVSKLLTFAILSFLCGTAHSSYCSLTIHINARSSRLVDIYFDPYRFINFYRCTSSGASLCTTDYTYRSVPYYPDTYVSSTVPLVSLAYGCKYYTCIHFYKSQSILCTLQQEQHRCSQSFSQSFSLSNVPSNASLCVGFVWSRANEKFNFHDLSDFKQCDLNCSCPTPARSTYRSSRAIYRRRKTRKPTTSAGPSTTRKTSPSTWASSAKTTTASISTVYKSWPTTTTTTTTTTVAAPTTQKSLAPTSPNVSSIVSSANNTDSSSSPQNGPLIAGLTVSAIVFAVSAAAGGLFAWKRRRHSKTAELEASAYQNHPDSDNKQKMKSSVLKSETQKSDATLTLSSPTEDTFLYETIHDQDLSVETGDYVNYATEKRTSCPNHQTEIDYVCLKDQPTSNQTVNFSGNPDSEYTSSEALDDDNNVDECVQDSCTNYAACDDGESNSLSDKQRTVTDGTKNPELDYAVTSKMKGSLTQQECTNASFNKLLPNEQVNDISELSTHAENEVNYQNLKLNTSDGADSIAELRNFDCEYELPKTELNYEFVKPSVLFNDKKSKMAVEDNAENVYSRARNMDCPNESCITLQPPNVYSKLHEFSRDLKNPYNVSPDELGDVETQGDFLSSTNTTQSTNYSDCYSLARPDLCDLSISSPEENVEVINICMEK